MSTSSFALVGAVLAGALAAIQAPTNAMMAKPLGSPVAAALISFSIGTAVLALIVLAMGHRPNLLLLKDLPWSAWLGGLYGAFFVTMAAFCAPRLGIGVTVTAVIAGQIGAAMIADHFGLLGLDRQPINPAKLGGVALILGGVWLVRGD